MVGCHAGKLVKSKVRRFELDERQKLDGSIYGKGSQVDMVHSNRVGNLNRTEECRWKDRRQGDHFCSPLTGEILVLASRDLSRLKKTA
jgi:hypothetical protein